MTSAKKRFVRSVGRVACLAASLLTSCVAYGPTGGPGYPDGDAGAAACPGCGHEAKVCTKPTVRALAHDLDCLEDHIERFGSVVAKQPDVWGQARMTAHRAEFEEQMRAEKTTFKESLQGSLFRSDQAFFADALALSAAVSGSPAVSTPIAPVQVVTPPATPGTSVVTPTAIAPPGLPNAPLVSDFSKDQGVITRTGVPSPPSVSFVSSSGTALSISLEPTERLDQEARYLDHLQHLRRINEGDDTADAPGYSLNLVRLPVSVLPGKRTQTGYGAEITFTATPYLSEELLPATFRNLVANDLLDQIGVPLTQVLNDKALVKNYLQDKAMVDEILGFLRCECAEEGLLPRADVPDASPVGVAPPGTPAAGAGAPRLAPMPRAAQPTPRMLKARVQIGSRITLPTLPATKARRALMPFPPSQLFEVYGFEPLFNIAHEAYLAFQEDPANRKFVRYPDVQGYLQEELNGAYRFLADPRHQALWDFCNPELVTAIRTHQDEVVRSLRCRFLVAVQRLTRPAPGTPECVPLPDVAHSSTGAFAWAYVVESALLTDQLVQDMKETAAAKACACAREGWLPYYLPDPPAEARQAFNEYVRCRWPIHVFALDPQVEEQNIADAFSLRRELQLALSLAFASGRIGASNMMRYARRIEQDYETIALNRTIVGFSHGDDTFGWRFYPRFQTPDVESNLTVLFRDLLIGGPNRAAVLRQRQLEPGTRECVAIVIMPSFVPYVTFDSSANWFELTNPKCKELNAAQAMRLSRQVRSVQECGPRVQDGDCYRCGDLAVLLRKADQLSQRLPWQSQMVQVPYENTLGGFAMFNTGVTDLAPQLKGWYGAEGIDVTTPTTIFLIGDHFSVLGTRVVAGGKEITTGTAAQELLSRQVLQVTVPAGAEVLHDRDGDFVDVHLATPYGVTQHLLVPVYSAAAPAAAPAAAKAAEGFALDTTDVTLSYCWQRVGAAPDRCVWKMVLTSAAPAVNLVWTDATAKSLPFAKAEFKFPNNPSYPLYLTATPRAGGDYPVGLVELGQDLLGDLNATGKYDPNNPPDGTPMTTDAIKVTPLDVPNERAAQGHAVKTVAAGNNLTVHFKLDPEAEKRGCPPPCLAAPVLVQSAPPPYQGPSWNTNAIAFYYVFSDHGITQPTAMASPTVPADLVVLPGDVKPDQYPTVDVTVSFDKAYGDVQLQTIRFDKDRGGYVVNGKDFAAKVIGAFGSKFTKEKPPPSTMTTGTALTLKAKPTPAPSGQAAAPAPAPQTIEVANDLRINWVPAPLVPLKFEP